MTNLEILNYFKKISEPCVIMNSRKQVTLILWNECEIQGNLLVNLNNGFIPIDTIQYVFKLEEMTEEERIKIKYNEVQKNRRMFRIIDGGKNDQ